MSAGGMSKQEKKGLYFEKLEKLIDSYSKIFLVNVDNVGSNQMHQVRKVLRGKGVILMGKNTMVRKVLRQRIGTDRSDLEALLPHIYGNIGFVFTNDDLKEVRKLIVANRVIAPAKAGAIAPCDVHIQATNTGMEPGKTSFFQALGIPTKIARGTIEIISNVHLIKISEKVGASEAALLNMLNISPFTYGLSIVKIFEAGAIFDASILDISDDILMSKFNLGLRTVASLSLAINFPTMASVPHSILNGYKKLLAIAVGTDYSFPLAEKAKAYLANPSAFAVAAPASPKKGVASPAKAKEVAKEESDEDMGFGLFD